MTRIAFVLVLGLLSTAPALAHKAIFVVRHAEKVSATDPASLISVSGEDRALALARLLRNSGVTHVFVTDVKRTAQTAEPLLDSTGLKPVVVAAADAAGLLKQLKAVPKDAVVVVVGHSNTIPALLKALGVKPDVVLKDDQYGRVFLITGDSSLVELAY